MDVINFVFIRLSDVVNVRRPPQWCYRQVSADNANVCIFSRILALLQTHSFVFLGKKRLFALRVNL